MKRITAALLGAAIGLTWAGGISGASAADLMPVKAPVLAPTMPLDVHGFAEYDLASTRVTGGGMLLYGRGTVNQTSTGLSLDLYKNPAGFVNGVSVFGGIWNETWNTPPAGGRAWQEMDWWLGFNVKFAQRWTFSAQMLQFDFPGGATDYNYVFGLALDDAGLGLPFALNPYVNMFYNAAGPSTVILGKNGGTYRFDLGIAPSFDMSKSWGVPITFTIPAWVTLGPTDYWNRQDGTTNFCGPTTSGVCSDSNVGYFATGLKTKYSLASLIPSRLGNWYLKADAIYYHFVADSLLATQTPTLLNVNTSYPNAERDVGVFTVGTGFTF